MINQSKLVKRSLVFMAGTVFAVGSHMALAATQQMGGQVTIQERDLSTQFQEWLNFGQIKVGSAGGTVTLTNDNTNVISATGDVTHVSGGVEGKLGIQGEQNYTVNVTVDDSFTMSAQTVAGAADLVVNPVRQAESLTLQANNGEWNYFYIGGTLTVPANQPADTYRGTYNATVNYQ